MSGYSAALALPPGDRDEAPFVPPDPTSPPIAGREPTDPVTAAADLLALRLDEATAALADVRLALSAGQRGAAVAAAWRLNEALALVDLRILATDLRRQLLAAQRAQARQPEEA